MESSISQLVLVFVATGWLTTDALVPPGYILQVHPVCGDSDTDTEAFIHLVTDLEVEASAECANGFVDFNTTDTVNFNLPVRYPVRGDPTNADPNTGYCMMHERADKLFTVKVYVSWGEAGSVIHTNEEQYQVTCTFQGRGNDQTDNKTITGGLVAPQVIQSYENETSIPMTLTITDVSGQPLANNIYIGRTIRLKGVVDSMDYGLHAVGCDAVGKNNDKRYAIIRAGCGDGLVFKKDLGFTTNANETWSPYFSAFTLPGNTEVSFECNFTLCTLPCTPNTCTSRVKRQSDEGPYILMQSEPIGITVQDGTEFEIAAKSADYVIGQRDIDLISESGEKTPEAADQRFWVAAGFLTVMAVSSLVLSVYALLSVRHCRRGSMLNNKV